MTLQEIARKAFDFFYLMADTDIISVGNGKMISVLDLLVFIGASEILIWLIHGLAGRKSDE